MVSIVLIGLGLLVSTDMLVNIFRHGLGYGMGPVLFAALLFVAVQLAGLLLSIFSKRVVLKAVFTLLAAPATLMAGGLAFASLGAPAPGYLANLALAAMYGGVVLAVALGVNGCLMLVRRAVR